MQWLLNTNAALYCKRLISSRGKKSSLASALQGGK